MVYVAVVVYLPTFVSHFQFFRNGICQRFEMSVTGTGVTPFTDIANKNMGSSRYQNIFTILCVDLEKKELLKII